MSDRPLPSLSQYFGSTEKQKRHSEDIEGSALLSETASKFNSLQLDDNKKNEPEVCRLFSETPIQPKDPTAVFFDLISNSSTVNIIDVRHHIVKFKCF